MSDHARSSIERQSSSGKVVVGIPAYNEEEAVADVVRGALRSADEVVVVDDGSPDRTAERAEQAGATVVRHDENRGYGAALETVFEVAHERDAAHLVVLDADGQHDPSDIPDLVETQRSSDAEIIVGSRFVGGSQVDTPLYRRIGLAVINSIVSTGLRWGYSSSVYDTQSGFRAYDATAVEILACQADLSDGMDASVDILFDAADEGCTFTEVPVDVTYDVAEANTHNPVYHGGVLLYNVVGRIMADRPVRLFGLPGTICLLFSLLLGAVFLTEQSLVHAIPPMFITLLFLAGSGLTGMALAIGRSDLRSD